MLKHQKDQAQALQKIRWKQISMVTNPDFNVPIYRDETYTTTKLTG